MWVNSDLGYCKEKNLTLLGLDIYFWLNFNYSDSLTNVVNVAEGVQDIRSLTYRSVVVISCLRDSNGTTITAENAINGAAFSTSPSSRPSSDHLM